MTPSDYTPQEWTCRYEGLRHHAIEPALQTAPLGIAMLMRHGVAYWMGTWSDSTAPSPSRLPMTSATAWDQWRTPLTELLAHITLQHLTPAYDS